MLNYKNATTWQPAWNHGKTQTIRVPIILVPKILEYARALDSDQFSTEVLQVIDEYIQWRKENYRSIKNSQAPNLQSRGWDELWKFRAMVAEKSYDNSGNTNAE